jgi:predicted nuclease of predicted toxin-antitoxin system
MRLLIDMNLTPRWVPYLISAGHESVHWSSVGPGDTSDDAICEFAREHGFALITNDLDFPQILAYTREAKPSVILLRGEPLTNAGTARTGAIESDLGVRSRTGIWRRVDCRLVGQGPDPTAASETARNVRYYPLGIVLGC